MKNLPKLIVLFSLLLAIGCAGAPDPEPEPTPEPAAEPVVEEAPAASVVAADIAGPARATARELRSIVERNNFGPESPQEYAAAETAFNAGESTLEDSPQEALALYEEASVHYRSIIDQGSQARAERLRGEVREERDNARSVRAEVAQRERYNRAQSDLDRAETLLEEEEFETSFSTFESSRDGFNGAYIAAQEQRERAMRSLNQLDTDLTETSGRLERMQQDMEASND